MSPRLLSLLERAANRVLALDPEADRVLGSLEGTRVALEVTGAVPLHVLVLVARGGVRLMPGPRQGEACDADVALSGTPSALLALLERGDVLPARAGVRVRGDLGALQRIRHAVSRLRPDWEEPLAEVFGDEIGHPLARGIRHVAAGFARAFRELRADGGEYLREESGLLPAADEVDAFRDGVDAARDAVERLEKRIDLLSRRAPARR